MIYEQEWIRMDGYNVEQALGYIIIHYPSIIHPLHPFTTIQSIHRASDSLHYPFTVPPFLYLPNPDCLVPSWPTLQVCQHLLYIHLLWVLWLPFGNFYCICFTTWATFTKTLGPSVTHYWKYSILPDYYYILPVTWSLNFNWTTCLI